MWNKLLQLDGLQQSYVREHTYEYIARYELVRTVDRQDARTFTYL